MGAPRIDVFVRGTDGALYQKYYDVNGVWNGWHKLTPDNTIKSDPAAVSWGPNRLDVFARGAAGKLVARVVGGNGWVIDPEGYLGDLQMTGGPDRLVGKRAARRVRPHHRRLALPQEPSTASGCSGSRCSSRTDSAAQQPGREQPRPGLLLC